MNIENEAYISIPSQTKQIAKRREGKVQTKIICNHRDAHTHTHKKENERIMNMSCECEHEVLTSFQVGAKRNRLSTMDKCTSGTLLLLF